MQLNGTAAESSVADREIFQRTETFRVRSAPMPEIRISVPLASPAQYTIDTTVLGGGETICIGVGGQPTGRQLELALLAALNPSLVNVSDGTDSTDEVILRDAEAAGDLQTPVYITRYTETATGSFVYVVHIDAPISVSAAPLVAPCNGSTQADVDAIVLAVSKAGPDNGTGDIMSALDIPLAPTGAVGNGTIAVIRSVSGEYPIFKASGLGWGVEFDTNIGNVPQVGIDGSSVAGTRASAVVFDDFVRGILPTHHVVSGLQEGVQYFARVAASNGLDSNGGIVYGRWSNTASAIPVAPPAAPSAVQLHVATRVYEVQAVSTAATHADEVQVISTSAAAIPEIQAIRTSAARGAAITGEFDIAWNGVSPSDPSFSIVQVRSTRDAVANLPQYRLQYGPGEETANQSSLVTGCLDWAASAA